ncbi:MAG: type II toxin-antitoxin system VapC family toxin [Gemmatimonadota bacterium]
MGLLVVDVSALVEVLFLTPRAKELNALLQDPSADLHAPAVCDLEFLSALRNGIFRGSFSPGRAEEALEDFSDLPLTRHGHQASLRRCFELREVLSAYDAAYVALAEGLNADLVTADQRLARAAAALGQSCFSP